MHRILFWLVCLAAAATGLAAQKPVAEKAAALFAGKAMQPYTLFTPAGEAGPELDGYVRNALTMSLRPEVLQALIQNAPGLVRLQLPDPLNTTLDLYRVEVFSREAMIRTSDGRVIPPNPNHLFYRGMISENESSIAAVSVFEGRIQILYADESGNRRIQRAQDGSYIALRDQDLVHVSPPPGCFTSGENVSPGDGSSSDRSATGSCIEVFAVCDYKSYVDNGSSVANTEEWLAELWNEVITLYENEDIPVAVSDVLIYTTTDPYAGLTTTGAILNQFSTYINNNPYNGRLAHFLSTRPVGGGVAWLNVLCSNSNPTAVSTSLSTNIIPVPTYSWSVMVVTHEMGHNIGSPHTHACAWNGNNTAIDGCAGYTEHPTNPSLPPPCPVPGLPSSGQGTIMSYCHLVSGVGINFNIGFGPQPGDLIRNKYNNAPCNTGNCSPPACTSLSSPAPGSSNADIFQALQWNASPGSDGYRLTVGTTPTNGNILNNVDVGLVTSYTLSNALPFSTTIYVKIVPYNIVGNATGCANQSFTTEANVAPSCTALSFPANGATGVPVDAILTWPHAIGNQTGYKISIGTTLNGTQIVNQLNVGNVTSYDHPVAFPFATTLYVKITPYWSGGDIAGCSSVSFTTWVQVTGDVCQTAVPLACGAALQGSTLPALPDPGLPVCGTPVSAPGIWYTFTGDGSNTIISTCSQFGYDTKLNAYRGSCGGLICVAGNDNFCGTGSQVTFSTLAGNTYYILVQGANNQQGTYTISRSCYGGPLYCQSAGLVTTDEWIKTVTVGTFTKQTGASSYSNYLGDTITVSRGGSYTVQLMPGFSGQTWPEYFRIWADFNQDGVFSDPGERIFSSGPHTGLVTGSISIPVTALTGNTRLRVSMRWGNFSSPCQVFEYGEVEDYTLNIKCNLVTTTADSGNGSLRNVSQCTGSSGPVLFAPSLNNQTITITSGQIVCNGQWKWMANAGSNIHILANGVTRILSVPAGSSIEIQNMKLTGGTATAGSAIDNAGTLVLRDCDVHRQPGSGNSALRNTGVLEILGICDIRF